MRLLLARFRRDEDGAAMVEYALLVALIALVAIVGVSATGTSINAQFAKISCKISTPTAPCDQP
jgi:pilus assembly protein Flp/PilA